MTGKPQKWNPVPMKDEKSKKIWCWIAIGLCIIFPIGIFIACCIYYYYKKKNKNTVDEDAHDSDEGSSDSPDSEE